MELFCVSVALAILAAEIGLPDGGSLDGVEVLVTVPLSLFVCSLCLNEKANGHISNLVPRQNPGAHSAGRIY